MSDLNNNFKKITYRAPSNIAFVKYWGKHGRQLPMNPSISMTLDKCYTETSVSFRYNEVCPGLKSFKFDGEENDQFAKRIKLFTESIYDVLPILKNIEFNVESSNSFPHSAGIASSASAMAALACCLIEIEDKHTPLSEDFLIKASTVARLGSGSASRSVYPNFAIWGKTKLDIGTDDFAIKAQDIHSNFNSLCDAIVIVSSAEKEVSSSVGHELMNSHLFKEVREFQANENFRQILGSMKSGDLELFGEILENEALTLHALMMTSYPSFILLRPDSLAIIEKIREFRAQKNVPLYFTIDAGPNIHMIYPEHSKDTVVSFINNELSHLSERIIFDNIGSGITRVNS